MITVQAFAHDVAQALWRRGWAAKVITSGIDDSAIISVCRPGTNTRFTYTLTDDSIARLIEEWGEKVTGVP